MEKNIQIIHDMVLKYCGINLPEQYIQNMLNDSDFLIENAKNNMLNDTACREYINEYIASNLLGMKWPINSDDLTYVNEFCLKWNIAVREKGWR